MFDTMTSGITTFINTLPHTPYATLWGPMIVYCLAVLETVGIIGFFIPLNLIVIGFLSAFTTSWRAFGITLIALWVGEICGIWLGYYIGRKRGHSLYRRFADRPGIVSDTLAQINTHIQRNTHISLPLLIISHIRSLIGLYRGAQRYSWGSLARYAIVGTGVYTIGMGVVGFLGKQVVQSWSAGSRILIIILICAIIGASFLDIRQWRSPQPKKPPQI